MSKWSTHLALVTAVGMTLATPAEGKNDGYDRYGKYDGYPGNAVAESRARAAALRARGLQFGYNLDHADALAAFDEAIAEDPDDPTAYRLAAATVWIRLLFDQGAITVDDYLGQARANVVRPTPNTALDAAFHAYLRQALVLSERRVRDNPADANAHYLVGSAFGFLATYTATVEGRLLGSFGPARRAYHEHERALELDPRRKDAGLIVGMYRYAVSGLSAPLRLLAHIAGFGGDSERGLRLVEAAAGYASDVQPNALFTLIVIYNREARYDDALRVIAELQRRFPRNRLLWLEAGHTALRAGRPAEANAALEEGLTWLSQDPRPRASGEEARWRYAHGAALVALKDVGPAERELQLALASATRDWVKGRIYKELGKLADLAGDRVRALDQYRVANHLCEHDDDSECLQEVQTLLKKAYR
jgi:tetratricopeptide (TPR) repeat protein